MSWHLGQPKHKPLPEPIVTKFHDATASSNHNELPLTPYNLSPDICLFHSLIGLSDRTVSELDGYNYVWKYVECCARSRHQGQGQVIKFHSICGMYTPTAFTLYIVQMCQVSCDDIIIVPIYMHIYLHLYIATLPTTIYFGFKDHYINSHLYVGTWNIHATVSILIFYCLLAHYRPRFYWCISADSRIIRYFWQTYICDMMINPKMFNNLCRLNFTIKPVFPNMYYSYHTIPY